MRRRGFLGASALRGAWGVVLAGVAPAAAGVLFFDPTLPGAVPDRLSLTGIYSDIAAKTPDTALRYFEVNAPLWSDGASKSRWLILPPGTRIPYVDGTDRFDYPDGARFVKLFRLERVRGDASTRTYWETRMLVNKKDAQGNDVWHGFTWRWNAAATEAWRVDSETGLDTVFLDHPRGLARPGGYRKWHFPNQGECRVCHHNWQGETGEGFLRARGILGFFPVQLKRPLAGGKDQVDSLFDVGTFTGTRPDAAQKRRRWKGLPEGIPKGLSSEARFRVIDTLARSYLAANCSGCHGRSGVHATPQIPGGLDYDFLDLQPRMDFALAAVGDWNLTVTGADPLADGRPRYVDAIARAGLDTATGAVWNMALPANPAVGLVKPGHPALSALLYRMTARVTPERDSLVMRRRLSTADPKGWQAWIFAQPWGSEPWLQELAGRGVPLDSVIDFFYDNQQMPRLATYMPDTAALKILGEWVRGYRTLPSSIGAGARSPLAGTPRAPWLQGRVLWLPEAWSGASVALRDATGRRVALLRAGRRAFALPASAPAGLYLGDAGGRSFRVVLR